MEEKSHALMMFNVNVLCYFLVWERAHGCVTAGILHSSLTRPPEEILLLLTSLTRSQCLLNLHLQLRTDTGTSIIHTKAA